MITEHDLHTAIAECQGERNPNANTCIKLAAFYTILNYMFPEEKPVEQRYSYASAPDSIQIESNSEFADVINGKRQRDVWPVLDELMETLHVIQPKLYAAVIEKLF